MLFRTLQSSCRQYQVTAAVAYSSYSLKDTYLCNSRSNIMYPVQAYTLQPPAVKIESLALTRESKKVLAAEIMLAELVLNLVYWILNNHIIL